MSNKTIYIVSERSFEYNDEIYSIPENGENSGEAQLAFSNKENALSIRDTKNIEWLRQVATKPKIPSKCGDYGLTRYTYVIEDIGNNKFFSKLHELCISSEDDILIPEDLSNDDCLVLVQNMTIVPWIVSEVVYSE